LFRIEKEGPDGSEKIARKESKYEVYPQYCAVDVDMESHPMSDLFASQPLCTPAQATTRSGGMRKIMYNQRSHYQGASIEKPL
jgi:hypothetical protein